MDFKNSTTIDLKRYIARNNKNLLNHDLPSTEIVNNKLKKELKNRMKKNEYSFYFKYCGRVIILDSTLERAYNRLNKNDKDSLNGYYAVTNKSDKKLKLKLT